VTRRHELVNVARKPSALSAAPALLARADEVID
jgi:hypothetical protein